MTPEQAAEVVAKALQRTGTEKKIDRGFNWACYCPTCCLIRRFVRP